MTRARDEPERPATAPSIPRVFHRIWFGGQMPVEFQSYGETFQRHHPDWIYKLWNESNLPLLRNQEQFDRASSYAQKADIARYEIIHEFGGIYVDTDFECLKPFESPLLDGVTCFCAAEGEDYFAIGIFGAVPKHPFLDAVIRAIPEAIETYPDAGPVVQTGPVLFTRILQERRRRGEDDVIVFPDRLFYPYHWSEPHKKGHSFPDAYAVHHWAGSWSKPHADSADPKVRGGMVLRYRRAPSSAAAEDHNFQGRAPAPSRQVETGGGPLEHAIGIQTALYGSWAPANAESQEGATDVPTDPGSSEPR